MRIWRCQRCGEGKRAPNSLGLRDTRRFCLKCSESEGVLVERSTAIAERRKVEGRRKAATTRRRNIEAAEMLPAPSRGGRVDSTAARSRWSARPSAGATS